MSLELMLVTNLELAIIVLYTVAECIRMLYICILIFFMLDFILAFIQVVKNVINCEIMLYFLKVFIFCHLNTFIIVLINLFKVRKR